MYIYMYFEVKYGQISMKYGVKLDMNFSYMRFTSDYRSYQILLYQILYHGEYTLTAIDSAKYGRYPLDMV